MSKKRKYIKQKVVIAYSFLVGIFLATYIKTLDPNKVFITLEQKKELESKITLANNNINNLNKINLNLKSQLNKYEEVTKDSDKSINDIINNELIKLKKENGYSDIEGEGITIEIKDSENELSSGQNPNDLIVHDIDILRIINDLKKSDVVAISINGERVILGSEIKCSGATITVNGNTYGQPFIINAIGDSQKLMASVISPGSYANLLREGYGIYINVEPKNDIKVNSYEKYE